jgi:hypothetical protein
VETTANECNGADPRTISSAGREAAHQSGTAASEEVKNLILDGENLIDWVGDASSLEGRPHSKVAAAAIATIQRSIATVARTYCARARQPLRPATATCTTSRGKRSTG